MSETLIIWEAPVIEKPEFRLYYDDKGHVLFYSGDKPEGKYIVVDQITFATARADVRVIDGKISSVPRGMIVSKLVLSNDGGQLCAAEDLSIVVDENYIGETITWKMTTYEL